MNDIRCPACAGTEFTFNEDQVAVCNGCGEQYQLPREDDASAVSDVIFGALLSVFDMLTALARLGKPINMDVLTKFRAALADPNALFTTEAGLDELRALGLDVDHDANPDQPLSPERLRYFETLRDKLDELAAASVAGDAISEADAILKDRPEAP